jgi:thiol-disulfide isomerase/thioredoxin
VVGIHPAGTPAAEIEKVIYGEKFRFPTLLTPDEKDDKKPKKLGAYPYTMLAYFVFVDSFGRVAAHGTYHDVYRAASDAAFVAKMGTKPTPALDASRWLNSSEPLTLDGLKGKTVLLDFWGQWSGPCVKQLPICEQLHTKFKDRGLVVIGVHSAHRPDKLDALLKEKKVTFPVMIDRGESADGFQVNVWPSYVLIDKTGKIAWGFSQEPPSAAVIEDFLSAKEPVIP